MPPHYTPDGSWYWTGTCWIPADHLQSPPDEAAAGPDASRAAPSPARSGPRWQLWLAATLAALLFACVTVGVVATRSERRVGTAPQTVAVPPADSIFALPFTDDVDSAAVQGTLTRGGVTETVTGVLDFAPGRALQVTMTTGSTEVSEFLDCAGIGYQLQAGGTWMASPQVSLIDRALGWAGGPPPSGLRVAGWEAAGGETAWHLESSSGASWWIGARTGHPLRFSDRSSQGVLALTFSGFDSQPALTVPPRGSVSTQAVQGSPGAVVTAPGLAVEIGAVDPDPRGLPSPPAGYQYKALFLSYQNNSPQPIRFDNSFTLTDAYGAAYPETSAVQMAPALPAEQSLSPGQAVSGWDVFLVARGTYDLTLRVGPPPNQQNGDFLVTIPVS